MAGATCASADGAIMRIFNEFTFEVAHHLPHVFPDGHVNTRLHGHSFRVRVTLEGRPNPKTGLISDLGLVKRAFDSALEKLDHRYLNEIDGLKPRRLRTSPCGCGGIFIRICRASHRLASTAIHAGKAANIRANMKRERLQHEPLCGNIDDARQGCQNPAAS